MNLVKDVNPVYTTALTDYCRDDKCPRVELHRQHDVRTTIDQFVYSAVPAGRVMRLDVLQDALPGMDTPELLRALRRLMAQTKITGIRSLDPGKRAPRSDRPHEAYYRTGTVAANLLVVSEPVPRRLKAVDESILRSVGRYVLKVFWQIHRDVIHDFGAVNERTIYRRLHTLVEQNDVARIALTSGWDGGYVLPDSPLLRDRSSAVEQIKCAYAERRDLCV